MNAKTLRIFRRRTKSTDNETTEMHYQQIEWKQSVWQLSTFANIESFVVYAPNEMHIIADFVRTEILEVFHNKRGFVVLLDRLASLDLSRVKLKSAFFYPYTLEKFESDPFKAEQIIKECFSTSNPYLRPIIRLNPGITKYNPHPSIALVGTRLDLYQQLDSAAKETSSLGHILLPDDVKFDKIHSFISNNIRAMYPLAAVEIGVHLGHFLLERLEQKSVKYVLVCVTLHGRPSSSDQNEVET